jgi:hypothetical protein
MRRSQWFGVLLKGNWITERKLDLLKGNWILTERKLDFAGVRLPRIDGHELRH